MYNPSRCWECEYASHDGGTSVCMYILIEGHRRGCYDGKKCEKWEPRTGIKRSKLVFGEGVDLYERE